VSGRLATEAEVPPGARRIAAVAIKLGWSVIATYARGTAPGRPPHVVDSLALRLAKDQRRAVAVWENARFTTGWLFGDRPPSPCAIARLRAELAA
jgi:hypothetical protein